jgi:UPF0716 protein FxsA
MRLRPAALHRPGGVPRQSGPPDLRLSPSVGSFRVLVAGDRVRGAADRRDLRRDRVGNTLALLLIFSIVGAWLAKQAGFGVIARMRSQLERGVLPGNEIVEGALVFAAGLLLLVPGFVTGIVGLVLLLPPVRHVVRAGIVRSLRKRVTRYGIVPGRTTGPTGQSGPNGPTGSTGPSGPGGPGVIDV